MRRAAFCRRDDRSPVVATRYEPDLRGRPTFIDVGAAYPDPDRLRLVVWGRNRDSFPGRQSRPTLAKR